MSSLPQLSLSDSSADSCKSIVSLLDALSNSPGLAAAGKIAEEIVTDDNILPLLHIVQSVYGKDESEQRQQLVERANTLLAELHTVAARRLEAAGWLPVGKGGSTGAVLYAHGVTGDKTEQPCIAGTTDRWQSRLLQSLPLLYTPGSLEGKVVWAVEVVHHQRSHQALSLSLSLPLDTGESGDHEKQRQSAVLDVLATEDDGTLAVVRQLVYGPWQGLTHNPQAEVQVDSSQPLGVTTEAWVPTTLIAMAMLNSHRLRSNG